MSAPDKIFRLTAATTIARDAGLLGLRYFNNLETLVVEEKGPQDLVSKADREVETLVRDILNQLYPDDGIVGEEYPVKEAKKGHGYWVIDPIDGTWCFLNGIAHWCVSIAYVLDNEIEVGVIYDPNTRELFSAAKGQGAYLNGKPIKVKEAKSLSDGSLFLGFSGKYRKHGIVETVEKIFENDGFFKQTGSGALGLAWTACGRFLGYIEPHMQSWDCMAGLLLIEEAGGFTNNFLTGDALFKGNKVVAGSKGVQDKIELVSSHW